VPPLDLAGAVPVAIQRVAGVSSVLYDTAGKATGTSAVVERQSEVSGSTEGKVVRGLLIGVNNLIIKEEELGGGVARVLCYGSSWDQRKADHSPPSSAEIKNGGALPQHGIMPKYAVK
jgi:hypothetical protein